MELLQKQMNKIMNWYYWRLIATATSFALFGLGGILLELTIIPIINIWPGTKQEKVRRTRYLIHLCFKAFIWFMQISGVLTYEIKGVKYLNKPGQLVVANHPTLLDVVFLISLIKNANCIVKRDLFNNIFSFGPPRNANYISNSNTEPEEIINRCALALNEGDSVIIFPEGTRTISNEKLKFQRGVAHIALNAHVKITPVIIKCHPPTLSKFKKWHQIPHKRFHIMVEIEEKVEMTTGEGMKISNAIAARKITNDLLEYYSRRLSA